MVFGLFKKKKVVRKKAKQKVKRKVKRKIKRKVKKITKRKKAKKTTKRKGGKRKPFGGYQIRPDAKLGAVIGMKPVTPSQMTKQLWKYIKRRNLAGK